MARTRIKICGISRVEDALAAAAVGADAIGMIFHEPSRRGIGIPRARQIIESLPAMVTPIALMVNPTTRQVLDLVQALGIDHVQLHGQEQPEQVAELRGLKIFKALPVRREEFAQDLDQWRQAIARLELSNLKGLVLETANQVSPGGTGIANDWATVIDCQRSGQMADLPPIIAAGGLNPDNVGQVVRDLRPYAVDVSSGVEHLACEKSPEKLRAFAGAVRDADQAG